MLCIGKVFVMFVILYIVHLSQQIRKIDTLRMQTNHQTHLSILSSVVRALKILLNVCNTEFASNL